MADTCCKLVGSFYTQTSFTFSGLNKCFISVNVNENTEYNDYSCNTMLGGYTVGSLNLAGYAGTDIYTGCPGSASVQVLWLRKYDCENDKLYFIYAGEGRSSMSGDAYSYVTLNNTYTKKTKIINASSQSGPTSLFTDIEQTEGIGMNYNLEPISFNSSSESGCTLSDDRDYYLQNFRIELVPGSIPVANYTFAYIP